MAEKGKALKCLVKSGGALKVGIKFLGQERGWAPSGNPNLWLAAVLVDKKVITTLHVESFEAGLKKLEDGLIRVSKDAPWMKWITLKFLTYRLKFQGKSIQKKVFEKLK